METRPWWHVFVGEGHDRDLSIICNALLALDTNKERKQKYQEAMKLFVVSLIEDGASFNDPTTFLWSTCDR